MRAFMRMRRQARAPIIPPAPPAPGMPAALAPHGPRKHVPLRGSQRLLGGGWCEAAVHAGRAERVVEGEATAQE